MTYNYNFFNTKNLQVISKKKNSYIKFFLLPGKGKIYVNKIFLKQYFAGLIHLNSLEEKILKLWILIFFKNKELSIKNLFLLKNNKIIFIKKELLKIFKINFFLLKKNLEMDIFIFLENNFQTIFEKKFLIIFYLIKKLLNLNLMFDLIIKIKGGGIINQINIIQKALVNLFSKQKNIYKDLLIKENLLILNSRIKERKKIGLKKARKSSQFHKR